MPGRSDEDLLVAAGEGDREAFGTLVERYHRPVIRFIHRFLRKEERDAAEDLAQDVFLGAWLSARSFQPRAKVLTWLLRITTNACLNYRRGRRLRRALRIASHHVPAAGQPQLAPADEPVLADEEMERLSAAIAALPPVQRAVLLLRHFHDLSYQDLAHTLEISIPAVESLLFRARASLRRRLKAQEQRTPPQVPPRSRSESS